MGWLGDELRGLAELINPPKRETSFGYNPIPTETYEHNEIPDLRNEPPHWCYESCTPEGETPVCMVCIKEFSHRECCSPVIFCPHCNEPTLASHTRESIYRYIKNNR